MISVPWNQRALPIPEKFPLLFSPFILFVQDLRMGTTWAWGRMPESPYIWCFKGWFA